MWKALLNIVPFRASHNFMPAILWLNYAHPPLPPVQISLSYPIHRELGANLALNSNLSHQLFTAVDPWLWIRMLVLACWLLLVEPLDNEWHFHQQEFGAHKLIAIPSWTAITPFLKILSEFGVHASSHHVHVWSEEVHCCGKHCSPVFVRVLYVTYTSFICYQLTMW